MNKEEVVVVVSLELEPIRSEDEYVHVENRSRSRRYPLYKMATYYKQLHTCIRPNCTIAYRHYTADLKELQHSSSIAAVLSRWQKRKARR